MLLLLRHTSNKYISGEKKKKKKKGTSFYAEATLYLHYSYKVYVHTYQHDKT
jgi:hypothetical protein